jgi:hypothetical protein
MSWLTQILRSIGGGPILDAVEAAEAHPTAANIGTAITTTLAGVPGVASHATVAVADLGAMVSQTTVAAITGFNPALGMVAAEAVPGILAVVEAAINAHLPSAGLSPVAPTAQVTMSPIPDNG